MLLVCTIILALVTKILSDIMPAFQQIDVEDVESGNGSGLRMFGVTEVFKPQPFSRTPTQSHPYIRKATVYWRILQTSCHTSTSLCPEGC